MGWSGKKWEVNLVTVLLSLTLAIVVLEVLLRLTHYTSRLEANQRYVFQDYFQPDPESGWDIRKDIAVRPYYFFGHRFEIWSNEIGCFDSPYKGDNGYILLLGDSFVFGFVPFADNWGKIIEDKIGRRVLKCGVLGFGTRNELIKAQKVISKVHKNPSLIIVGYFLNDMEDDYTFPRYTVVNGYGVARKTLNFKTGEIHERSATEIEREVEQYIKTGCPYDSWLNRMSWWLKKRSILYNESLESLRNLYANLASLIVGQNQPDLLELSYISLPDYPWIKEAWAKHFDNITAFKQLASKHQAQLLFVLIPAKEQVYQFLRKENHLDLEQPNRIVRNFLEQHEILYLDMLPRFREYADHTPRTWLDSEKDLYWKYDGHWNAKGNHLAGLLCAEYLLEQNLLDLPERNEKLRGVREGLSHHRQSQ